MTVSRWERGAQEPPSHGYIGLGNLSRDTECWFFWERAGLRSEDCAARPSDDPEKHEHLDLTQFRNRIGRQRPQRPKTKLQLVAIPLLKVAAGSGKEGDNLPLLSDAPVESMIAAPSDWCPNPSYTSCLRVRGNSMLPLIHDGFVVAVDASETDLSRLDTGRLSLPGTKTSV